MADEQGDGSGRRRTAGRPAAGSARRRPVPGGDGRRKALPPGFAEGRPLPDAPRSTVRMEPREKLAGVAAAVLLAVIAVLFITVTPAHGQPRPNTTGPIIALVLCGVLVASLALANRIVSGLLAIVASFLEQTPHVAHSILYLRKGALVVAVAFALWLTLQQRHAQIDNRLRRAADRHRGDPGS